MDASNCFLQMVNELEGKTTMHREQAEWVVGERSYVHRQAVFVIDFL